MENIDRLAITSMRMLSVDAIQKAKSGHPGMAIGSAPMAYTLWKNMRHDPKAPEWMGRDRFVLSAGHASMLLYSLMHIFGYPVSMDDIKNFRQLGAPTAGHPEYGHIPGIEATTGPLGQGFAMAVGMAMAERHMAARFNREGCCVIDNFTYTLMGDGCMMEGVASEAASLAGTLGLGRLIALYDSNRITIEGSTDLAFTEHVRQRCEAYGWQELDDILPSAFDTLALRQIMINYEPVPGKKMLRKKKQRPPAMRLREVKTIRTKFKRRFVVPQDQKPMFMSIDLHGTPLGSVLKRVIRPAAVTMKLVLYDNRRFTHKLIPENCGVPFLISPYLHSWSELGDLLDTKERKLTNSVIISLHPVFYLDSEYWDRRIGKLFFRKEITVRFYRLEPVSEKQTEK